LSEEVDVLIIGAGVAQAAAAAGYRVRVLEQQAIAAGTSSRSSKLVHGGLRYLESHQYALVRKTLKERDLLLRNAPELVRLTPFYIPVYSTTRRGPGLVRIGLMLYSLLGGLRATSRFRAVPRADWKQLAIAQDDLLAVYQFWDAQTDDVALTHAVIHSAQILGVELVCPASFVAAQVTPHRIEVIYRQADKEIRCTSRVLVNASGPWVNDVLARITPIQPGLAVELVQGTHIVLDNPPPPGVFYVEAPQDRRAIFIMPWHNKMLVGTTETVYTGEPGYEEPLPAEIDYLRDVFRHYFPTLSDRILESYAGLRVLPKSAHAPFKRPRDTVLHIGPERVLSLYGGKLTGYRATAHEVMQQIKRYLTAAEQKVDTRTLRLHPSTV
jgi:glycerol-3-phosphate dehydrogenase